MLLNFASNVTVLYNESNNYTQKTTKYAALILILKKKHFPYNFFFASLQKKTTFVHR